MPYKILAYPLRAGPEGCLDWFELLVGDISKLGIPKITCKFGDFLGQFGGKTRPCEVVRVTRLIDLLARCLSNSVVFKLASLECQWKYLWCVQLAFSERVRRLLLEAVVTASRKTWPFAPTGAGELTGHWTRHEKYDMKTFPQLALTFGTGSPNWVPQLPRTGDCFKRVGPLCEKASGKLGGKINQFAHSSETMPNASRRQNTSSLCSWSSIRLANTTGIGSSVLSFRAWKTTWRWWPLRIPNTSCVPHAFPSGFVSEQFGRPGNT